MILLDTNAIIYYLQNDAQCIAAVDKLRRLNSDLAISTISEVEVFGFPQLTDMQILEISRWLGDFQIIPVDSSIARHAARLRREYKLKTPDAIIVATAVFFGVALVTRDRELQKIKGLEIVKC